MQEANVILLLLLSLAVVLAVRLGPRSVIGERPLVSSYNAFMVLFFMYVCFSASLSVIFNGGDFTWAPADSDPASVTLAIAIAALSLVLFLFGYGAGVRKLARGERGSTEIARSPALGVAWSCVVIGLALKVYLIYAGGGVSGSLLRLSGGIRDTLRIEGLDPVLLNLRTLSGMADAGASWIVLNALKRRNGRLFALCIFAIVIGLSFFSIGKRLVLVWPSLCLVLGFHYYVRRLTIGIAPVALALLFAVGAGSLFFRIFLPASVADVSIDLRAVPWAGGSLFAFYFYSLEFSTFEMLAVCVNQADRIAAMFGGEVDMFITTNIIPLFFAVPRFLWPGKPEIFLDVSHALLSIITGVPLEKATAGTAGTLIGVCWATGGIVWLSTIMALFGRLCARIDRTLLSARVISPQQIVLVAFGINLVLHIFRQGTVGWIFIITVLQQYGMISAFLLIFVAGTLLSRRGPRLSVQARANSRAANWPLRAAK
ncbi:hypothetical protein IVB08_09100 [Bradyrhizobium sp. 173]|uniref:hypothetical protein n=1 Tax=Bradyrhizobium sp. 173 TaxID=2782644 RepID=UPI001FFA8E4C|nr:hypothetical protein [Bradyrhizobium sp. 173]MCK1564123.1 hypothetical protein [Bradyrhizobium sp. 173]